MENLKQMTDEALVRLYAEGNNEAFDVLLCRHKSSLYSYIYFLVRNREVAEDIFQETFMKAIVTIRQGRYTENGKFKAWIMRIAHNLVIDGYRQERNERTVSNEENGIDLLNNSKLCEDNIEDVLIQKQILKDVRRLICYLPDSQKEVLMMRYYENLSFKEIADITGVSINTALGRMRYAILNMRKIAEEKQMILTQF
ncbi:MAG: sigma-70 family RNA polymerase sigma factor [Bacteroidales bacterium]|nr:sigma-70 family RNA polymerase sigma factor [Bacteroidales bacterium]